MHALPMNPGMHTASPISIIIRLGGICITNRSNLLGYHSQRMNRETILQELDTEIEGDVLSDRLSRMLYATDASPYQQLPMAIARPRHRQDCVAVMQWAHRHRIPIIPRAAGTSLAGQCVGEGVVVDCSRYMNALIDIDAPRRRARVQPGLIRDELNDALRPLSLMFAPDPSTADRCTIGGMLGNNAWGIHALRYGSTRNYVVSTEAVLSDGSVVDFGPLEPGVLQRTLRRNDRQGEIVRTVFELIERHHRHILQQVPAPDGIARNAGYPLDVLARGAPWNASGAPFNPALLLCGSEGTLALVTEIKLRLVPLPRQPRLLCAHFRSVEEALLAVAIVMPERPVAVELLDRSILDLTKHNLAQQRNRFWIEGEPGAVLLIEFHSDSADVDRSIETVIERLHRSRLGYCCRVFEPPQIDRVWSLRKAGLGLLMGMPGPLRAITGIEDSAVAVADLPAYIRDIKAMLARYQTECVIYGPAGRGCLHLRPLLNLTLASDRKRFTAILAETAELVARYGGTLSAKHGDGRLRAPFLEQLLGSAMVALMQHIKTVFDPAGLLNPHKILDSPPPVQDLRFASNPTVAPIETVFDWRHDSGFSGAAQKCNGAAVCLKRAGHGTMCPSYMASREEKDSTRGRAAIFRQLLNGGDGDDPLTSPYLKAVLDLCLSCKGCRSECPANVDMARMKAEFLQHHHDRFGVPLRARILADFERFSRWGSLLPQFTNALLDQRWLKERLGFHPDRALPKLAKQRFSWQWNARRSSKTHGRAANLLLVLDPFSEFFEPGIAAAAVTVLERCGHRVQFSPCLSLGRTEISQGLLRRARKRVTAAIEILYPCAASGRPIVGLEPSEILTLRDEAPDLVEGEALRKKAQAVADQAMLFEEFISREQRLTAPLPLARNNLPNTLLVHGHCHQKSLVGMQPTLKALSLIPGIDVKLIPSGCCGMAGAFGYEAEHYALSLQIAELILFPAIRQAPGNSLIVASGASCRQQIADGLGMRAWHPAEILAMALGASG